MLWLLWDRRGTLGLRWRLVAGAIGDAELGPRATHTRAQRLGQAAHATIAVASVACQSQGRRGVIEVVEGQCRRGAHLVRPPSAEAEEAAFAQDP